MAVSVPDALARVTPFVLTSAVHPDHGRTVEHATLLRRLASGDIAPLLRRYTLGESEEQYQARLSLTISTVPAVFAELSTPYFQVSRLKGSQVERRLDYDATVSEAEATRRRVRLEAALSRYYEARPVEDYLSERIVRSVSMTDPNAWLLTTFSRFDFRTEVPQPFPLLIPCEQVADFTRAAGQTESVTFRFLVTEGAHTAYRYVVYLENDLLECWPVLWDGPTPTYTLPEGATVYDEITDDQGKLLSQVRLLSHRAGRVPAAPVGFVPDPQTSGRTYISPLNPAVCFLEKELKTGSELDIVMSKVVHPHKSQYVPACSGQPNEGCNGGKTTTGNTCALCHGTALSPISTSAIEVSTFPLPKRPEDMKDAPDLSKLVYFNAPDVALPKFQVEYQDWLVARASRTLFNTNTLVKTSMVTTAAERIAEARQKNNALSPMGEWMSRMYVHIVMVEAGYLDVAASLSATYRLPPELIPVEISDLEEAFGDASKAGLDAMYLQHLYEQLMRHRLADNPDGLRKALVKMRFVPYLGLSDAQFLQYAALNYIPAEKRTLRIEQDSIFYELETKSPGFYDLAPVAQQTLVDAKVKELVAALGSAAVGGTFGRMSFTQPAQSSSGFGVGDTVMVKPGMEHMPEHKGLTMTVAQVQGNTYAVKLPDSSVHKWYTANELMGMTPASKSSKMPAMAM